MVLASIILIAGNATDLCHVIYSFLSMNLNHRQPYEINVAVSGLVSEPSLLSVHIF